MARMVAVVRRGQILVIKFSEGMVVRICLWTRVEEKEKEIRMSRF